MNRYFECENCGQVVQGFEASRSIDCCEAPFYHEIDGPETATATKHTEQALSHYRSIEATLATLSGMLEQTDFQNADNLTVTTLWAVSNKLLEIEGNWEQAIFTAKLERTMTDAREQALDQEQIRNGG